MLSSEMVLKQKIVLSYYDNFVASALNSNAYLVEHRRERYAFSKAINTHTLLAKGQQHKNDILSRIYFIARGALNF